MRDRKDLGRLGEQIAVDYLKKNGYKILERNYACVIGEIDIVAKDKDALVFIEVRTRSKGLAHAYNFSSVDRKKQYRLSKMASYFLKQHGAFDKKARFDVVSVALSDPAEKISLIKDAFELALKYQT